MPRFYNSLADAQTGIRGHKGRAAAAAAIRAQEEARRADPRVLAVAAARRAVNEEHRLKQAVGQCEFKRDDLKHKLEVARSQLGRLDDVAYATGSISEAATRIRAQIGGLPELIQRADDELAAARQALADHRAIMAKINADEGVPVTPETPVAPKKRGRA